MCRHTGMCRHKPDSTVPAHPGEAVSVPARLPAQRARLLFTLTPSNSAAHKTLHKTSTGTQNLNFACFPLSSAPLYWRPFKFGASPYSPGWGAPSNSAIFPARAAPEKIRCLTLNPPLRRTGPQGTRNAQETPPRILGRQLGAESESRLISLLDQKRINKG